MTKWRVDQGKIWLIGLAGVSLGGAVIALTLFFRPAAPQVDLSVTQAYQTVAFQLTRMIAATQAAPPRASATSMASLPSPASTPGIPTSVTPLVSLDPRPTNISATPTLACDRAAAGNPMDITVPDDTEMDPGQPFTKIWRLQNIGSCTWTPDYAAQFFYGERMGAPDMVFLGKTVAPGQTIEIAVDLIAPSAPGVYQGNWKMRNANGILFGIGPKGDAPFWVRIQVRRVATATPTPTLSPTPTLTPTPDWTATPTLTPTLPVASSGTLRLTPGQTVDLDQGQTDPQDGQDLAYLLAADFHQLTPQSGAVLGVYGATEPGLSACQLAGMSSAPIALESLTVQTYLCYRTGESRLGWLRYDGFNTDQSVVLTFQTWAVP